MWMTDSVSSAAVMGAGERAGATPDLGAEGRTGEAENLPPEKICPSRSSMDWDMKNTSL